MMKQSEGGKYNDMKKMIFMTNATLPHSHFSNLTTTG